MHDLTTAVEAAPESMKAHALTPLCDWGLGMALTLPEMIATLLLGVALSLAWVIVNEQAKSRPGHGARRTPVLSL